MDSRTQIRDPADDWLGVTDIVERKRLQNRLAQRARRAKRSRDNKSVLVASASLVNGQGKRPSMPIIRPSSREFVVMNSPPTSQSSSSFERNLISLDSINSLDSVEPDWSSWLQESGQLSPPSTALTCPSSPSTILQPSIQSPLSLILNPMPAVVAYYTNAHLLNLSCEPALILSQYPSASTPRSLAATSLQLSIPHMTYIDTIPFPSVRNRILSALSIIDQDDFRNDMVEQQIMCWGRFPWDGKGWELPASFVDKWWFLVDEDVVDSTNFWRRERGEADLLWRGKKNAIQESRITSIS